MAKFATTFIAALLLTGCVEVEKYPDEWGPLNIAGHADACPKIGGVYKNTGEMPDGKRVWLAHMLSDATEAHSNLPRERRYQYWMDLYGATHVQLLLEDRTTLTIAAVGEGMRRQWSVSNAQFRCKAGAIVIDQSGMKGEDVVITFQSGALSLYRTSDGLVVNSSGGGAGLLLFLPVVGYSSGWARFSLIEER